MALRGRAPESVEKRLKMMVYGDAGSGKTTCSMSFPRPYVIDCEGGGVNDQYLSILKETGGVIFGTADFDELYAEVRELSSVGHEYKTLVIDPITVVYKHLLELCERRVGSAHGRHYGEANKRVASLTNLILRLDMNVIVIARAKNDYGDSMSVIGKTYDGPANLDYLFDLVLETRMDPSNKPFACVKKTRIAGFPHGERFPFSYAEVLARYGSSLERDAVPIELVSETTLSSILSLVKTLGISEDYIRKNWLDRLKVDDFSEVSEKHALMILDKLTKRMNENV